MSTTSTACSSARGPATSPSLVTWPVMTTPMPSSLAMPTRASVQFRTCATPPGIWAAEGSRTAWMESTARRNGARARAVPSTVARSRPGANATASPAMPEPSRPGRDLPVGFLARHEQALPPGLGRGETAAAAASVDLPIPGSPARRTTEAGTSPPPRTRSRPGIPVGTRGSVPEAPPERQDGRHGARPLPDGALDRAPGAAARASTDPLGHLLPALRAGEEGPRPSHGRLTLAIGSDTPRREVSAPPTTFL